MTGQIYSLIKRLFSKEVLLPGEKIAERRMEAERYFDVSKENITAIVANALAMLVFGDSSVTVEDGNGGENKRSRLLNAVAKREFTMAKRKISAALGVGMIASIPFCEKGALGERIYIDTITKDRFWITGMQGDDITEITALSDIAKIGHGKYMRWTDYSAKDGVYVITNRATDGSGREIPLSSVEKWTGITPKISIGGVDRLPVAFYSSPVGARRLDDKEGKPITYGSEALIEKIARTLSDIEEEFRLKKVRLMIPRSMLFTKRDSNGRTVGHSFEGGLFMKVADRDGDNDVVVFDPAIRESAYFSKLEHLFSLLEKSIGCSRGILTDLLTNGATATEIKRAMNATFCLTDDLRKEYRKYFDDLMYSVNVLCNYHSLTPPGDYAVSFDWNYSLLEDSSETFRQMREGKAEGVISSVELRRFLKPDESAAEARSAIDAIKENEPSLRSLMGLSE